MILIDIMDYIRPKVASVMNSSRALAIIAILLLPTLLGSVYASNSFDNIGISQNKSGFRDTINLTNNERDSVYGQVSTFNENVYVVWQESVPGNDPGNYDILFKRSTDNGSSFSQEINLSNNIGFSEHPQLISEDNHVYVIWADDTNGNREVYLKTSSDNGNSLGKEKKLSDNGRSSSDSYNAEIASYGKSVYAVWLEKQFSGPYRVMLGISDDNGKTFENPIAISEAASEQTHPKISAFNGHIYIVWNVDGNTDDDDDGGGGSSSGGGGGGQLYTNPKTGVFFVSSPDNGATFGNVSKLNTEENGFGEAQITSSGNEVYVIWAGSDYNKVSSLYFVKSNDNGRSFNDVKKIEETQQGKVKNPTSVEIAVDESNKLFIAWQDTIGAAEDKADILFAASLNGGESFQNATNISNNTDMSECPSITVNGDNIYITWEDLSPGNHEILYKQGYYSFNI